jgi:hypothetical protein
MRKLQAVAFLHLIQGSKAISSSIGDSAEYEVPQALERFQTITGPLSDSDPDVPQSGPSPRLTQLVHTIFDCYSEAHISSSTNLQPSF